MRNDDNNHLDMTIHQVFISPPEYGDSFKRRHHNRYGEHVVLSLKSISLWPNSLLMQTCKSTVQILSQIWEEASKRAPRVLRGAKPCTFNNDNAYDGYETIDDRHVIGQRQQQWRWLWWSNSPSRGGFFQDTWKSRLLLSPGSSKSGRKVPGLHRQNNCQSHNHWNHLLSPPPRRRCQCFLQTSSHGKGTLCNPHSPKK